MDSATISALAALSGAVIGGVTSFGTSWLSQQTQAKVQARAHKLSQREELYKHFIENASKAYADSLARQAVNVGEITQLVDLYALVSMMRVISSTPIVESANHVVRLIADSYVSPNKTLRELHQMVDSDSVDALRAFSEACRAELQRFQMGALSLDPSFEALVQRLAVIPLHQEKGHRGLRRHDALQSARLACLPDRSDCDQKYPERNFTFREMPLFDCLRK